MLKLKVPILKKARVGGRECKLFPLKVKTLAVIVNEVGSAKRD